MQLLTSSVQKPYAQSVNPDKAVNDINDINDVRTETGLKREI